MNPAVHWPAGARPQSIMCQHHDVELLDAELKRGEQAAACQAVQIFDIRLFLLAIGSDMPLRSDWPGFSHLQQVLRGSVVL